MTGRKTIAVFRANSQLCSRENQESQRPTGRAGRNDQSVLKSPRGRSDNWAGAVPALSRRRTRKSQQYRVSSTWRDFLQKAGQAAGSAIAVSPKPVQKNRWAER